MDYKDKSLYDFGKITNSVAMTAIFQPMLDSNRSLVIADRVNFTKQEVNLPMWFYPAWFHPYVNPSPQDFSHRDSTQFLSLVQSIMSHHAQWCEWWRMKVNQCVCQISKSRWPTRLWNMGRFTLVWFHAFVDSNWVDFCLKMAKLTPSSALIVIITQDPC